MNINRTSNPFSTSIVDLSKGKEVKMNITSY